MIRRSLLAQAGRRVIVLERDKFPRFHIGESLLPYTLPTFERMGIREELDRTGANRKKNEAQVEATKASLDQAEADFETNILTARADVEGAKAAVLEAEINLGYCRMSSPIDGRIGLAEVKLGNLVGPASAGGGEDYTELAVVRQLDPMGIDIQVSSRLQSVRALLPRDRVLRFIVTGDAALECVAGNACAEDR